MRVMTVMGTRPEVIRLSAVIDRLDAGADHIVVHTGQNYDPTLHDQIFAGLGVRPPDVQLRVRGARAAERVGAIIASCDALFGEHRPDRLLVLGDTDSCLAAYAAKRRGIPVFHMEAGNRCYDDRAPEEVNRRVIDHCSDVLLPYTSGSARNLEREGIASVRIHVTGNPIHEVMQRQRAATEASDVVERLGLAAGRYFLLTAHRQENVDDPSRLRSIAESARRVADEHGLPVVWSVHPRTRQRLSELAAEPTVDGVLLHEPFDFHDFVALERHAHGVLTDSGTVQEECCLLGVPTVTIRDNTERPETVECGSNVLSGVSPDAVSAALALMLARSRTWRPPAEYLAADVSATVAGIVLGPLPRR